MVDDRNGYVDYTQGTSGAVSGDLSNYYTKAQTVRLVNQSIVNSQKRDELINNYKAAHDTYYVEPTKVGDKLVEVGIWTDSDKSTKLYTKTMTWSGDLLLGVDLVDNTTGYTLSKEYTYQNGEWKSTQVSYGG